MIAVIVICDGYRPTSYGEQDLALIQGDLDDGFFERHKRVADQSPRDVRGRGRKGHMPSASPISRISRGAPMI